MANASILAAFERMWQHVVAALGNKADTSDVTDLQNQMDSKANVEHGHDYSEIENVPVGEVTTGGDTLTWDGNTEGRYTFSAQLNIMGQITPVDICYLSNVVPSIDIMRDNEGMRLMFGGEVYEGDDLHVFSEYEEDGFACLALYVYIVPYDNYTIAWETATITFPYAGTYFSYQAPTNMSLTIPNFTGFPSTKKLDVKYLPDTISPSVELTQAEYDVLEAAGETDPETVYYITDADPESGSGSGASSADKVSYDNSASGLEATDLQSAMDEISNDVSELNQKLEENFQDGVNTILSAVNTKTGTALTGANTPTEIADAITNIKTKPTIISGKTYAKSCGGSSCSMTAGCYEYYVVVTFSCKADITPTISVTNGTKTVLQSQKAPVSSANDYITYTTILKIVTTKTASVVKVSYSSSEWGDYTCDWIGLVL